MNPPADSIPLQDDRRFKPTWKRFFEALGGFFTGERGTRGLVYLDTGTPENVVTAPPGMLCIVKAGGAGVTLYVKETGTGNTGWSAK